MKKQISFLLFLLCMICSQSEIVNATTKQAITLLIGEVDEDLGCVVNLDLDEDGKMEALRYDEEYNFYINNTLIFDVKDFSIQGLCWGVIDVDKKDKYKELVFYNMSDDFFSYCKVFRYKNGLMELIFQFDPSAIHDFASPRLRYNGEEGITVLCASANDDNAWNPEWVYYTRNYKIKDKELKSMDQKNIYKCYEDDSDITNTFYATSLIHVQKSLKNNKTKFSLKYGDTFTVQKIYINPKTEKKFVYIRTEKGKTGWVKWSDNLSVASPE